VLTENVQTAPWWKTGTIYQIYPRSFQDSNGDGIGDLKGIADRLDYLQWLGVDAIWLSPIYQSPMADFGYDVSDFTAVDPIFGTMDDFDHLVAETHARGLKLIMDFVPNHTSSLHPWFLEARASRDNPKRDWYIWADPDEHGNPPNNWLAYFGGPAWTLDEKTGQYYLHNFLPEQPDLNYRNPAVKEAVWNDMRFWLDRGVDGFRLDVIDRMLKDPALRDNPVNPNFVQQRDNPTMALQRVHSEGAPGIHKLIQAFQKVIHAYPERVSIGEIQYFSNPDDMTPFYGDAEGEELDLPFNFGLLLQPWHAETVRDFVMRYDAAVPAWGWPNYVWGNHDQHRLASRVGGKDQARLAAMLLLTLRGTPFIYQGEELGMENVDIPQELVQDPQGKNMPGFTRDVARTPMHWNDEPNAGFTTGTPWLPVSDEYVTFNVETERTNPTSILSLYHRLLGYRRLSRALTLGNFQPYPTQPDDAFVYVRAYEGERRLIALNFSHEARTLDVGDLTSDHSGRVVLSTHVDRQENADLETLHLRPLEGVIVEL
jgi:alpha-glucosidase